MTCDQTQRVSLLIDGELTAAEQSAVERHLLECAECHQAREEFLNLRSELVAYQPALTPAAADAALARILSKQGSAAARTHTATPVTRQSPFSALFSFLSLNPRLASVVALLAVAFTVGGIVFLRSRPQSDLVNNTSTTATTQQATSTQGDETSKENPPLPDVIAQRKPNGSKTGQPNRGNKQLHNRGLKPERDRTAPSQPPRPQIGVPPTYAAVDENLVAPSGVHGRVVGAEMLMARHLEQSELLLRSFRNIRDGGSAPGIGYERRRARQLLYQNIRLQREADDAGDVEVASLLGALEPILLDIANLRDKPDRDEVRAIRERVERKNLVPLLQVNSTMVARAYD